jgi:hypothetical protein
VSDHDERKEAEQAARIANLDRMLTTPLALDELRVKAQYRRRMYDAYVAAGFAPGQALYLCTTA